RDLRIDADHFGVRQRFDEPEVGRGGRKVDVAARLVRLGLERKTQVVLLVARVLAEKVDRIAKPLDRFDRILGRIDLGALAAAPEDIDSRPPLNSEITRSPWLLQGMRTHARL